MRLTVKSAALASFAAVSSAGGYFLVTGKYGAGGILFIAGVYFFFLCFPLSIRMQQDKGSGKALFRDADSDYLVVVDPEKIAADAALNDFSGNDWSYAWCNTLMQETGWFAVCRAKEVSRCIPKRRAIIVTKSAAGTMPGGTEQELSDFVSSGGVLVLEDPDNSWRGLTGLTLGDGKVSPTRVSYVDGDIAAKPYDEIIMGLPLNTDMRTVSCVEGDTRVVMKMDDIPAVCLREYGKGGVVTVNFNYGLELVSLQQGIPSTSDYAVKGKIGQPQDMISFEKMIDNSVPYADILERIIAGAVNKLSPIPSWWYFPAEYKGVNLVTHDCEMMGDDLIDTALTEDRMGVKSTFFIIWNSPVGLETLSRIGRLGTDIELHWDRAYLRRLGVNVLGFMKKAPGNIKQWFYRLGDRCRAVPAASEVGLSEQKGSLRDKCGTDISLNRLHGLRWGRHYTEPFGIMERAGITADSSFGPNDNAKGYLFGTALPFHPIDVNGYPFEILELPFQTLEARRGADIGFIRKLFEESGDLYNQAIVTNYHPDRSFKGSDIERQWKETFEEAARNGHWTTTMKEYIGFFSGRSSSPICSGLKGGKIDIQAESRVPGMCLRFPADILEEGSGIFLDGAEVKPVFARDLGIRTVLVGIPEGRHRVELTIKAR
ncbi:MAG: hypothetical protein HQL30_06820 [Candidatus Omnitrophica bacterium]|nr:hypothetical protein [Candidatus Omnitrophota bacterium]